MFSLNSLYESIKLLLSSTLAASATSVTVIVSGGAIPSSLARALAAAVTSLDAISALVLATLSAEGLIAPVSVSIAAKSLLACEPGV